MQSKNIYSEFTTNVEELTKDMNDYLDRKVYTNYFADIAPMILDWCRQYGEKGASNQNQTRPRSESKQIQSEIYLHRKNNHYSAMATHKENHISSESLKGGMRSQIRVNTYVNQTPIKTNKRSDHIVIKHINAQSLIEKLDEIKLLIEN